MTFLKIPCFHFTYTVVLSKLSLVFKIGRILTNMVLLGMFMIYNILLKKHMETDAFICDWFIKDHCVTSCKQ